MIDKMHVNLLMEVHNIVQGVVIKAIPPAKEVKKDKMVV